MALFDFADLQCVDWLSTHSCTVCFIDGIDLRAPTHSQTQYWYQCLLMTVSHDACLNLHSMLTIWLQTRSKCVPHSWICMSDGSLGSLHRWRSQRIAKYWSCELQDTLAQLFFWAAEHLTYSTYTSLAVLSHSDSVSTHYWLQRARLRVLFNFSLA